MADNASRDQNSVPTLLGVSSSDGSSPVKIYADPSTHRLLVNSTGGGGTPGGNTNDVQFNDSGTFGGSDSFTWNDNVEILTVNGTIVAGEVDIGGMLLVSGVTRLDSGSISTDGSGNISISGLITASGGIEASSVSSFDSGSISTDGSGNFNVDGIITVGTSAAENAGSFQGISFIEGINSITTLPAYPNGAIELLNFGTQDSASTTGINPSGLQFNVLANSTGGVTAAFIATRFGDAILPFALNMTENGSGVATGPVLIGTPNENGTGNALQVTGVLQAENYHSSDNSAGINTTITTASLSGKTITVKNGLITGFA